MTDTQRFKMAQAGVGVIPITPFTDDLSAPDLSALASNIEFLVDSGVNLLYAAGNTSEVSSISEKEWTDIVEVVVAVAGSDAVVAVGIGHEYPVALRLARRARDLGAAGILTMPRQQAYIASQGIVDYWTAIVEAAELPAVVYNRGMPTAVDLDRLLHHELVIGCKYADPDVAGFAGAVAADTSGVMWTCGIAERYAPFFHLAGAVGFTSGLANFAPRVSLSLYQALRSNDWTEALHIREICSAFENARARREDAYNVSAVKVAMDAVGLAGGRVRPPLMSVDGTTMLEVTELARALDEEANK